MGMTMKRSAKEDLLSILKTKDQRSTRLVNFEFSSPKEIAKRGRTRMTAEEFRIFGLGRGSRTAEFAKEYRNSRLHYRKSGRVY